MTQINLKFPERLMNNVQHYAKNHGYINIQEFIRDVVREKVEEEVNEEYLKQLRSKDATTFISEKEADDLDKQLEKQANSE